MRASTAVLLVLVLVALAAVPVFAADPLSSSIGSIGTFVHSFASSQARFQGLLAIALFVVFLVLFHLVVRSMPHMQEAASGRLLNAGIIVFSAVLAIFATANIPPAAIIALQAQYQIAAFVLLSLVPVAIIGGAVYLTMQFKNAAGRILAGILLILLGSNLSAVYNFAVNQIHLGVLATILAIVRVVIILLGIYFIFNAFGDLGGRGEGRRARSGGARSGGGPLGGMVDAIRRGERRERGSDKRGAKIEERELKDVARLEKLDGETLDSFKHAVGYIETIGHYAAAPEEWESNIGRVRDLYRQLEPLNFHKLLADRIARIGKDASTIFHEDHVFGQLMRRDEHTDENLKERILRSVREANVIEGRDERTRATLGPDGLIAGTRALTDDEHTAEDERVFQQQAQQILERHRSIVASSAMIRERVRGLERTMDTTIKPAEEAVEMLNEIKASFKNALEATGGRHSRALQDLETRCRKALPVFEAVMANLRELKRLSADLDALERDRNIKWMRLIHQEGVEDRDVRELQEAVRQHSRTVARAARSAR